MACCAPWTRTADRILRDVEWGDYLAHFREGMRSWTYMNFPYLRHLDLKRGGTAWGRWPG